MNYFNKVNCTALLAIAGLLSLVCWQQWQLSQSQSRNLASSVTHAKAASAAANAGAARAGQRQALIERARQLRMESPQATGERMYAELLAAMDGEKEDVRLLLRSLLEEAQTLRTLRNLKEQGGISAQQYDDAAAQLRRVALDSAEQRLTRHEFDRYRELRQSWKRGRLHESSGLGS